MYMAVRLCLTLIEMGKRSVTDTPIVSDSVILSTDTIDGFIEYKIKKELSYVEIYDSY